MSRTVDDQEVDPASPGQVSAAVASEVLALVRVFGGIKARVATGPESDHFPAVLLGKLEHFGPSRASDLAEHLCADPSTVSRQVATLVKSGLVERRADPDDGRASILVLTDLGRARAQENAARRGHAAAPVLEDWTTEERATFLGLLRRYTAGVETHRDEIIRRMLDPESGLHAPVTASAPAPRPATVGLAPATAQKVGA